MNIGSAKSNEQLTNEVKVLRDRYSALVTKLDEMETLINSKPKLSDIQRVEASLQKKIEDNAALIVECQRKLAMVILPEEPRYYLTYNEITNFQSNLAKLLAMMTSFEELYKNLVAYSANLSSTNI